jgi:hypothetical protein
LPAIIYTFSVLVYSFVTNRALVYGVTLVSTIYCCDFLREHSVRSNSTATSSANVFFSLQNIDANKSNIPTQTTTPYLIPNRGTEKCQQQNLPQR